VRASPCRHPVTITSTLPRAGFLLVTKSHRSFHSSSNDTELQSTRVKNGQGDHARANANDTDESHPSSPPEKNNVDDDGGNEFLIVFMSMMLAFVYLKRREQDIRLQAKRCRCPECK